jgi:hypothetical protein
LEAIAVCLVLDPGGGGRERKGRRKFERRVMIHRNA